MRIVRVLGVLLASSVVAAQHDAVGGGVEQALAAFADDDLPALLARLTDADAAVSRGAATEIAALGAPAHEALLGVWLGRSGPRPAGLATAFGDFDAGCGWALPVLIGDGRRLTDPLCRDLLQRLGAAALPAIDELRRQRAAGADRGLDQLITRIERASDAPRPTTTKRDAPQVEASARAGLLSRLAAGPERWPALQALLCLGDDAAEDAAFVLLELSLEAATATTATQLRDVLAYRYLTRCLPDPRLAEDLAPGHAAVEARRLALARRRPVAPVLSRWLTDDDADLRRSALLAIAEARTAHTGRLEPIPPTIADDADPRLRAAWSVVRRVLDAADATTIDAAIADLATSDPQRRHAALNRLMISNADRVPEDLAETLWHLIDKDDATTAAMAGSVLQRLPQFVSEMLTSKRLRAATAKQLAFLLQAASRPPQPAAAAAELLRTPPPTEQDLDYLWQSALAAATPAALIAGARAALTDADLRADLLANLHAVRRTPTGKAAIAALAGALAPLLPDLPPTAQLDLLAIYPRLPMPRALWETLLASSEPTVRHRCLQIWRQTVRRRPAIADLIVPLLDDADLQIANTAATLLGFVEHEQQTAVTALLARWPQAIDDRASSLGYALARLGADAAVPIVEASLGDPDWHRRLIAAHTLLVLRSDHAAAAAELERLLVTDDADVRVGALYRTASPEAVAERFVDRAIDQLDDPDEHVVGAAARFLGAVPAAQARTVPLLEGVVERFGEQSLNGQRALSAIRSLRRAERK